ncbi:MAG: DUF4093 domain-containing protein [Clostridia bacterium]|nr:DUF4093 domain-containing protein [Clostridia bacterium]
MLSIKEAIIVEGKYDKIKLSGFLDSFIFVADGFSIFNNKKDQQTIKTLAEKTGIVILTDSDSAGIKIRNFIKQLVPKEQVKHAYIPEVEGKEKRKTVAGKEGLLGVEGITEEIITDALIKSGCTICGESEKPKSKLTKTDFYKMGLSGGEKSAELRRELALKLGLPSKLSANMLLEAVNRMSDRETVEEYISIIKRDS